MQSDKSRLAAALTYIDRGLFVVALHSPDPSKATGCSCGDSRCNTPAKHPRWHGEKLPHGDLSATRDPDLARDWWSLWPGANLGIVLEPSRLVSVSSDNQTWAAEFQRRGLPATAQIHSGGGPGHVHSLYRRPKDCPSLRECHPGEYDLLSGGLVVAPPSLHVSGRVYEWVVELLDVARLPECPGWAVEELRKVEAARAEKKRRAEPVAAAGGGDEPPVRLDSWGMEWWTGDRRRTKAGGGVDRSGTLCAIARVLFEAGASESAIERAVTDRDRSLGYEKYTDRTDATLRYREIAKTIANGGPIRLTPYAPTTNNVQPDKPPPPNVDLETGEIREPDSADAIHATIRHANDLQRQADAPVEPLTPPFRSAWDVLQDARNAPALSYLPMLAQDGYVAVGWSNLVSGYPKGGKTELIWASVQQWLKAQLEVVWATEEGDHVWGPRLQKVECGEDALREADFRRLTLLYSLGIPPAAILAGLVQRPETIVIVDTVRTLMGIENELDNAEVARVLGRWESGLMGRTRIYLHHARKQGGERGQRISGASAFLACIDRALEVDYGETKSQRVVTVTSRLVEPQPLLYEMRKGRLLALGDPGELRLEGVMNRIALVLNGEWTVTRDVRESLGDPLPSLDTVSRALLTMAEGGRAERNPPLDQEGKGKRIAWRAFRDPGQTSLPLYIHPSAEVKLLPFREGEGGEDCP